MPISDGTVKVCEWIKACSQVTHSAVLRRSPRTVLRCSELRRLNNRLHLPPFFRTSSSVLSQPWTGSAGSFASSSPPRSIHAVGERLVALDTYSEPTPLPLHELAPSQTTPPPRRDIGAAAPVTPATLHSLFAAAGCVSTYVSTYGTVAPTDTYLFIQLTGLLTKNKRDDIEGGERYNTGTENKRAEQNQTDRIRSTSYTRCRLYNERTGIRIAGSKPATTNRTRTRCHGDHLGGCR